MRVGAVSVSLTERYRAEIDELPELSAVLCAPGHRSLYSGTCRIIEVNRDWLEGAPAHPIWPTRASPKQCWANLFHLGYVRRPQGNPPGRGDPQASPVWYGRPQPNYRADCPLVRPGERSAYGFTATLATWLLGGQVLFATRREDIVRGDVNLIIASPAALNALRKSDAPGGASGSARRIAETVIVAGGRLATTLREELLRDVCSEVLIAYGSSEAGGVTLGDAKDLDRHPGTVGHVFPDVEVQIADDAGAPVQPNGAGQIRVRTNNAVKGFLGDPIATGDHFKDGWFYPGDIGTLSPTDC